MKAIKKIINFNTIFATICSFLITSLMVNLVLSRTSTHSFSVIPENSIKDSSTENLISYEKKKQNKLKESYKAKNPTQLPQSNAKAYRNATTVSTNQSSNISYTKSNTQPKKQAQQKNKGSYITIGGKTIQIFDVASTAVDAGSRVARFSKYGEFLYGHNSSTVFGHLKNLGVGQTFTVTLNGKTKKYIIAEKQVYCHEQKFECKKAKESDLVKNKMYAIASSRGHSLSIMTCHGTPVSNVSTAQRLVIFADEI